MNFLKFPWKMIWLFLFSIVLTFSIPVFADAASATEVTLNFMCPCGTCDEALSTCECPQSDGFRSQIAGMVGQGYTEDQIVQDFTNRFGPGVLITNAAMAPGASEGGSGKNTFGFILLLGSFTLAAFGLGRYMRPATPPAPAGRKPKSRTRAQLSSRSSDNSGEKRKTSQASCGEVDEELLDDYIYK